MVLKKNLTKIHWLSSNQLGIDPIRFCLFLYRFPKFFINLIQFRNKFRGNLKIKPCLHDYDTEAGLTQSEYFWQDLFVARKIFNANPEHHVDIGSRIDGFVAHVASFRSIEVLDIRPVTTQISNINFKQVDLLDFNRVSQMLEINEKGYCDSLSCLHALEHFGLGRYGDPINPKGFKMAITNMTSLLMKGGKLYLSTPIGCECVLYNSNWIFDPRTIHDYVISCNMKLDELTVFNHTYGIEEYAINELKLEILANRNYSLGIFVFTKI